MKKLSVTVLTIVMFCLFISIVLAESMFEDTSKEIERLNAKDALLVSRIRGLNKMVLDANIERAEIQGVKKWLIQKQAEMEAKKLKAKEQKPEKQAKKKKRQKKSTDQ